MDGHVLGFAIIVGTMLHHGSSLGIMVVALATELWTWWAQYREMIYPGEHALYKAARCLSQGRSSHPRNVAQPPICRVNVQTSAFLQCLYQPGAGVLSPSTQGWHGILRVRPFKNRRTFLDHIHLTNSYHMLTMGQIYSRHWEPRSAPSWSPPSHVN